MFLLLSLAWSVSSRPLFCQNMNKQIEKILNSLQTIRSATDGVIIADTKLPKLDIYSTEEMCGLAQKLTNYLDCDLDLSTGFNMVNATKIETSGLVDNMQMHVKTCVLSPPVCPVTADLSLWNKIHFLLDSWYQDVAAISNTLQSVCPDPIEKPA